MVQQGSKSCPKNGRLLKAGHPPAGWYLKKKMFLNLQFYEFGWLRSLFDPLRRTEIGFDRCSWACHGVGVYVVHPTLFKLTLSLPAFYVSAIYIIFVACIRTMISNLCLFHVWCKAIVRWWNWCVVEGMSMFLLFFLRGWDGLWFEINKICLATGSCVNVRRHHENKRAQEKLFHKFWKPVPGYSR